MSGAFFIHDNNIDTHALSLQAAWNTIMRHTDLILLVTKGHVIERTSAL